MGDFGKVGIKSYGVFIPKLRLSRASIVQAHSWAFPNLRGKGEKAICSWDEDAITMAVEAVRDCVDADLDSVAKLTFASTTAPFADLLNAGTISVASRFSATMPCSDRGGSTRAGLSALIEDLESSSKDERLTVASDCRRTKPASTSEMRFGSGAAAMLVGTDDLIASYVAGKQVTVPFTDHYRMAGQPHDYYGEERWIRDEGVMKVVPDLVTELLKENGIAGSSVTWFGLSGAPRGSEKVVGKRLGLSEDQLIPDFQDSVGDTGTAHPFLQLAAALERASPGDIIVIAGFGYGCDVAIFRKESSTRKPARGLSGAIADRIPENSYFKALSFDGELQMDWGPRAEVDTKASFPEQYRSADQILGFVGGRCDVCGAVQFPRATRCVSCANPHSLQPFGLSSEKAEIATLSADWLQYYPAPPLYVGLVQFEVGARLLMEIVDVGETDLDVGTPLRMVFRIKAEDKTRNYRRYFWKAAPL